MNDERVAARGLGEPSLLDCLLDRLLEDGLVEVVSTGLEQEDLRQ